MRGLAESPGAPPRPRGCAQPRAWSLAALLALALLVLTLPSREHLSAWTTSASTTLASSFNSVSSLVGWRAPPVADAAAAAGASGPAAAREDALVAFEDAPIVQGMRFNTSAPPCRRTFTFAFGTKTGFNGLLGMMVRAATVAEALGFSLLIDDDHWIYGRWTDYFEPWVPDCMPANDWRDYSKKTLAEHHTDRTWKQADHVYGPASVGYLDQLVLALYMNQTELDDQHRRDIADYPPRTPLASHETVPSFFVDAFRAQSRWMARLWRPSAEVRAMIEDERATFGWNVPGWDDRPREKPADVVVAAHVRMGDKCRETTALKAGPLRFASTLLGHKPSKHMDGERCDEDGKLALDDAHAQHYFDAAAAEVNAILSEHAGRGIPQTPDVSTAGWAGSRPTLIIMSDEDAVLAALKSHRGSRAFNLVHTQNADVKALQHGYNGGRFLALDMADRVATTRPMVRDMELLARHAGGLVFMSASNVGRALALLPGFWEVEQGRLMAVECARPLELSAVL